MKVGKERINGISGNFVELTGNDMAEKQGTVEMQETFGVNG